MRSRGRTEGDLESLLRTVPLFSNCSKRDLKSISNITKEVRFEPGQEICREGEVGVGMHVIVEGETKIQIGERTRRRLGPGAFFGEIAVLDGGPRTATVIAETPVTTLFIASWNFKSTLKKEPTLMLKVLEEVCRRLRTSHTSLND